MCKSHQFTVRHLFDCELCGNPVSSDDCFYDSENNWCEDCKTQVDYESAIQFWPYRYINKAFGRQ